jgi:hypothetical protein
MRLGDHIKPSVDVVSSKQQWKKIPKGQGEGDGWGSLIFCIWEEPQIGPPGASGPKKINTIIRA